jgi:hypothetical protein
MHQNNLSNIVNKIFVGLQTSGDSIYVLRLINDFDNYYDGYSEYLDKVVRVEKVFFKPYLEGKRCVGIEHTDESKGCLISLHYY